MARKSGFPSLHHLALGIGSGNLADEECIGGELDGLDWIF
jgi:hypothetical protein